MKHEILPLIPRDFWGQAAIWYSNHLPKALRPLFDLDSGGRTFALIFSGAIAVALWRVIWVLYKAFRKRKENFWRENFGRKSVIKENGQSKSIRIGASRSWSWEVSLARFRFRRVILKVSNIDYSIDEQYVFDRLHLIEQQMHLRFVDCRVEKGVIYLYRDRTEEDIWINDLPRPSKPLIAIPAVDQKRLPVTLDFTQESSIGIFGKSGSGKSFLVEAIVWSLRQNHKNLSALIASTKLEIDFIQALNHDNSIGVNPSTEEGKSQLVEELKKISDRNKRLQREFSELGIRHLKDHPKFGQPGYDIQIVVLDELNAYTSPRSVKEPYVNEIVSLTEELLRQGRAYSCILILCSQTALSNESLISLAQLHRVASGSTRTAEASKVLFGDDRAFDSKLLGGRMILRDDKNYLIKVARVEYVARNKKGRVGS